MVARPTSSLRRHGTMTDRTPRLQGRRSRTSPQTLWPILAYAFRFESAPLHQLSAPSVNGAFHFSDLRRASLRAISCTTHCCGFALAFL